MDEVADIKEEQEEESLKEEKTDNENEKVKKKRKPKVKKSKSIITADSEDEANDADYENEETEVSTDQKVDKEPVVKRETRKYVRKIKKHQSKIYDDLEIEEEIKDLLRTGLKNKSHTVTLSRLVVRAKNLEARSTLLDILKNGDKPCRQLFIDYNGLKLFYNYWMNEINMKNASEIKFCIKLIEVLDILQVKNKTIVRDSKVMLMMEKWKNLDLEEKRKLTKEEKKKQKQEEKLKRKREKELKEASENSENVDIPELMKNDSTIGSNLSVANLKDILDKTTDSNSADPQNISMDEITSLKLIAKEKATELFKKWDLLVEDIKIPKKQKLEEMKLHEKEADLSYQATEKDIDRRDGTDR